MKPFFARFLCVPVFAAVMAVSAVANAGEWKKIVSDSGRTVEVDTSAIFNSDHGAKVAWGRIVLNAPEAKQAGYQTIKALNRYDCLDRSFTTVKRVYLDGDDNVIREETVPDQMPVAVRLNSVDERIWRSVCGVSQAAVEPAANRRIPNKPTSRSKRVSIGQVADAAHQAAQNVMSATKPVKVSQAISGAPEDKNVLPLPPKTVPLPSAVPPAPAEKDAAPQPPESLEAPSATPAPIKIAPAIVPPKPVPAPAPVARPAAKLDPIPMLVAPPGRASPSAQDTPPKRSPSFQGRSQAGTVPAADGRRRESAAVFLPPPRPSHTENKPTPARAPVSQEHTEEWAYFGAKGPDSWGYLNPNWRVCTEGSRQSPIDFSASKPIPVDLEPVKFDYRPSGFVISNNALFLRGKVGEEMSMEVRGKRYVLDGFTLHRPAETRIDGRFADMEAHFFHRDDKGRIAVLAVQFVRGEEPNAPLQTLLNNLPLEKGDSYMPQTTLDMTAFLPKNAAHYLYMGSLSMPPCTEGVLWVVMKEPLSLSEEQFGIFARLHASNARPTQPANARLILESR
ncbi:MAG: carbonic anhydrase family protein [Azoarcus sp.]|jgi:carbonic anhydrase|nr:carbonic anhydrase family protein [Azoarcus sp.]